jgi:hypothetical protein
MAPEQPETLLQVPLRVGSTHCRLDHVGASADRIDETESSSESLINILSPIYLLLCTRPTT